MATTFARQYSMIGSLADWSSNDIVLGLGEIGFAIQADNSIWGKVGDGVSTFSALEYTLGNPGIPLSGTLPAEPVTAPIEFDDGVFFRNFTIGQDLTTGDILIQATGSDAANTQMDISINSLTWTFLPTGHMVSPNVAYTPTDGAALTTKDYVDAAVLGGVSADYIPLAGTGVSPVTGIVEYSNTTIDKQYNFGIIEGLGVDNLALQSTGTNFLNCSFVVDMNDYLYWFMNTGRFIMPDIVYGAGDDLAAANKKYVDQLRQDIIDQGVAVPPVV